QLPFIADVELLVFADGEKPAALGDAAEKARRAEVTVSNPDVVRLNLGQYLGQQGALLSVGVCRGNQIQEEPPLWLQHGQGVARQGGGASALEFLQTLLGAGEVVAVEDLDPVPRSPRWRQRSDSGDSLRQADGAVADHGRPQGRLHAVDLLIESRQ